MEISLQHKQVPKEWTQNQLLMIAGTQHVQWLGQPQTMLARVLVEKLLKIEEEKVGNQAATVSVPDGEVRVTGAQIYALRRILRIVFSDPEEFIAYCNKMGMIKQSATDK